MDSGRRHVIPGAELWDSFLLTETATIGAPETWFQSSKLQFPQEA